jgi:hypothetical protein
VTTSMTAMGVVCTVWRRPAVGEGL